MEGSFTLYEFQPLAISMERVGPFNDPYEIEFTGNDGTPCNFFLMVAANGFGKTTVLETMAALMGLLGEENPRSFGQEDLDSGRGRAQLDVLVRAHWRGRDHRFVLSLLGGKLGDDVSLKVWDEESLKSFGAEAWQRAGYRWRGPGLLRALSSHTEEGFVADLFANVITGRGSSPVGFEEGLYHLPSLLFFSAYRDIPPITRDVPPGMRELLDAMGMTEESRRHITQPAHWGYRPLHGFSPHNEEWGYSLDNLLVWLRWLDDGRYERARDIVNERVFGGATKALMEINRDPPEAVIQAGEGEDSRHRLDRLSSGEKNLVQLFLRIGAHMTGNSIVLIDEFDVHLHIRWQHKLFNALKAFVGDHQGVTVIATTHSVEILESYVQSVNIIESGRERQLVKGGHLIENIR